MNKYPLYLVIILLLITTPSACAQSPDPAKNYALWTVDISPTKDGSRLATGSEALRIWTKDGNLLYKGKADGSVLWGEDWTSGANKLLPLILKKEISDHGMIKQKNAYSPIWG